MQSHSTRSDSFLADLPKPGVPLSMAVLVGAWLSLLLYDLISGDYGTKSPTDYDLIRSLLPLLGLLPWFLRLLKPKRIEDDQEAYRVYSGLTKYLLATVAAMGVLSILPFTYLNGTAGSLWSFMVGRTLALAALLGFPPVAEGMILLFGYRSRRSRPILAPIYTAGLIVVVVLGQIWPMRGEHTELGIPEPMFVLASLLMLISLILMIRIGWIVNLRKRQKLAALGWSMLGMIACGTLTALQEGQTGQAMLSLFPGLGAFGLAVALPLGMGQWLVFLNALLSLPTADAIDRRNTEVTSLANFGRLLTRSFNMNDLIDAAVTIACDVTKSGGAWIELVGEDGQRELLYGSNSKVSSYAARHLMRARTAEGLELSDAVSRNGAVQIVDRAEGAKWQGPGADSKEIRSVAAAPLRVGTTRHGTLYVAKEKAGAFDREDMIILGAVADQIALAVEQSRLIRNSIQQERFEQEMLIARDLQQRLLPTIMPESPFYELCAESQPASLVGGDYYDVVSFNDQTIGVLIADVSGKGASAALYMGMIKGIIQALSGRCVDPRELLSRTNVALFGSIDNRWFATMTCAQIVEERRVLKIARAGHCPTLLVRSGRACWTRSKGIGLAIAKARLFDGALELEEVEFAAGDYAIFLSDGLPEARSPDGEEFGYDRLLEVAERAAERNATPREMRDAMFDGISTFTAGELPGDDSTLVVIKWR